MSQGVAKLAKINRFTDVTVSAQTITVEDVLLFGRRGEYNDGYGFCQTACAQAAQHFETVHFGQFQVEEDEPRHVVHVPRSISTRAKCNIERLHAIARESVERYGGELPDDEATLRSFKGIGAYTAGAVLSFAFGQRAAILDTNVARVLFRIFVGAGDPKSHAMRRHLWEVSRTVLPMRHVFDFNQALMDFGATLCTARKPQCPVCPMRTGCAAYPYDRS